MIKESCDLTGQEHILVTPLKVCVIHDKMTLFSLEFIMLHYFYCGHTTLRPTKFSPGKSKHFLEEAHLATSKHKQSYILAFLGYYPYSKKYKTLVFSFLRYYLKLVSAIFYQFLFLPLNDSPFKTMKNAFYFIWKALHSWDIQTFNFSPPLFFSLLAIALEDD